MRFSAVFEFHKIPEWYDHYFPYNTFVKEIESYGSRRKFKGIDLLPGIYYLAMGEGKSDDNESKNHQQQTRYENEEDSEPNVLIVPIPIFVDGFEDVCEALKAWIQESKHEKTVTENQLSMIEEESQNESDIESTTKETEKWMKSLGKSMGNDGMLLQLKSNMLKKLEQGRLGNLNEINTARKLMSGDDFFNNDEPQNIPTEENLIKGQNFVVEIVSPGVQEALQKDLDLKAKIQEKGTPVKSRSVFYTSNKVAPFPTNNTIANLKQSSTASQSVKFEDDVKLDQSDIHDTYGDIQILEMAAIRNKILKIIIKKKMGTFQQQFKAQEQLNMSKHKFKGIKISKQIPGKLNTKNMQRVDCPQQATIIAGIMNPNVDQELLMAYLNTKQKKSLEAHREAQIWICKFNTEVDKIESFFNQTVDGLIAKFIKNQHLFHSTQARMLTMPSLEKYKEEVQLFNIDQKILNNYAAEQFITDSGWRYGEQGRETKRAVSELVAEQREILKTQHNHVFQDLKQQYDLAQEGHNFSQDQDVGEESNDDLDDAKSTATRISSATTMNKQQTKEDYSHYATLLIPHVLDDLNKWNKAEKLNTFAGNLANQGGTMGKLVTHKPEAKDEFERMTDWGRCFILIWTEIKWLKTFGQINKEASRKIVKKFMKNYFQLKDNSIDKQLTQYYENKSFVQSNKLQMLSRDVLCFYALAFMDGNLKETMTFLNTKNAQIRRQDAISVSFFGGVDLVLSLVFAVIIAIPSSSEVPNWKEPLATAMIVYYMLFILIFIIGATGFCVQIFSKYGVNYSYIFELDIGSSGLRHHQLYIIALKMLFIWFVCLILQTISFKFGIRVINHPFNQENETGDGLVTLICLIIFAGLIFNPYELYQKGRIHLFYTLSNIFMTPFGLVRFRHFFLTDVLTSITGTLKNLAIIYVYFGGMDQTYRNGLGMAQKEAKTAKYAMIIIGFIPSWLRFGQCLHKYFMAEGAHKKTAWYQLINAGKYGSDILASVAALWVTSHQVDKAFYWWLCVKIWSTLYKTGWDYRMDWGMCRSRKKGYYALRNQIHFAPTFYYWAMFSNTILRFFFLIVIGFTFWSKQPEEVTDFQLFRGWFVISMLAEALRRTQWSLLRVENEQYNNFEQYREIRTIPPMVEDATTGLGFQVNM